MREIYAIKGFVLRGKLIEPGEKVTVKRDMAERLIAQDYAQAKKPHGKKGAAAIATNDRAEKDVETR